MTAPAKYTLNQIDLGALIAGVVAVIFSFFPSFIRAKETEELVGKYKDVEHLSNAWFSYATWGMILVILATVVVALIAFAPHALPTTIPWRPIAAVSGILGAVLLIIRAFTLHQHEKIQGVVDLKIGLGWSGWITVIAAILVAVLVSLGVARTTKKV
ncbi:MAG: DUF5336 domain-containing protein [Gordonia sp. (in: high G+C Gram-positive bacteria)]|uniref:hypothetical protein n=1 Tax=Gordonia sp. (in: high G+C Gram-positive bacteria) TaxID=84139 RepID=UPI0039E68B17